MLHTESRVAWIFEINAVRRDPVNIGVIAFVGMAAESRSYFHLTLLANQIK